MREIDALKRARGLFGPEAWVGRLEHGLHAVGFWEAFPPPCRGSRLIIRGSGNGWNQAFKDARRRRGEGEAREKEAAFLDQVNRP